MAIYCLRVTPISRGSGRSAVGAAAYRAREKLHNEYDDITHDYTRRKSAIKSAEYRSGENDFIHRKDVIHSEIILPHNAPERFSDRQILWNAVELSEKNSNARTAREVLVALPNELNTEQQIKLVQDYVKKNFVDNGMCADFSIHSGHIHDRDDEKYPFEGLTVRKDNPHAHILLTVRPLNKDGSFSANKTRKEYILDNNGNKIKLPSGQWKSRKIPLTDWDKTETLEKWRENWAVTVNKKFEQLGIDERIDHRTLKAQGIDREPTKHIGVKAWNLEKKGIATEQLKEHRAILARNKAKAMANKGFDSDRMRQYREVIAHNEAKNQEITSKEFDELLKQGKELEEKVNLANRSYNDNIYNMQMLDDSGGTERHLKEIRQEIKKLEDNKKEIENIALQLNELKGSKIGVKFPQELERQIQSFEDLLQQKIGAMRRDHAKDERKEHNKARTPEVTAEYIHELKQGYVVVDNKISALKQEISHAQQEINSFKFTAENINERAEQINNMGERLNELKTQRREMGIFGNKKDIDRRIQQLEKSHEQAENAFKREYKISPEQAGAEIQRLENRVRSLGHLQEKLNEKLKPLIEEKDIFEYEYTIQKTLLKISPERQIIQKKLTGLSQKPTHNKSRHKSKMSVCVANVRSIRQQSKIFKIY